MKKLSVLLGARLLSASPASAGDFLYVFCEFNGTNKITSLPSGKVISESPLVVDTLLLKVDLINNKMRSHAVAKWTDFRIKGNQIISNDKVNMKGFSSQVGGVMPLNPPGPSTFHNWYKTKTEYQVIKGEGECREIDSSVFEEASKQ